MAISPQSQEIYKILLKSNRPLPASILADQMRIPTSLTYRLTEPLIMMGLVVKLPGRPYQFIAKPVNEGLSLFLLNQNEWFSQKFSVKQNLKKNGISNSKEINFSFIQSRDELMNISTSELKKTVKSFDILRSGHEISAETMLSMFEARKRGIRIRMLIQDYSSNTASQAKHWIENGILVRRTSLQHIRLMIYDSSVTYFMSYKHKDSFKDLGMKVDYSPFAVILSCLFDNWWKAGEII